MHEVHFLTITTVNGRRGWIAPVESPASTGQSGTCTVPVDSQGQMFSQYQVTFVKYLGQGRTFADSSLMELQPSGFLEASINGSTIRFQPRVVGGAPAIYEYVGKLTHPDFRFRLAEIEPETEQQLDDLYSREGIVVAGCDPAERYGGMESIKARAES
jgi:hypothetical protein